MGTGTVTTKIELHQLPFWLVSISNILTEKSSFIVVHSKILLIAIDYLEITIIGIFQLVKLVADVLYKSPANNDFIYMVEHRMMDDGIANYIEGLSSSFAARGACAEFKVSTGAPGIS